MTFVIHINELAVIAHESAKNKTMQHKFRDHIISNDTEILILGTFHPDVDNNVDFFYSRSTNYLWRILPAIFDYEDLKNANLQEKRNFMLKYKIDFADIIETLENLPIGQEQNVNDKFIQNYVGNWKDIIGIINKLPNLKAVYFTRKTFNGIPIIENKISEIRNYCVMNCLRFCILQTPARFSNLDKINNWRETIINKTTCR